MTFYAYVHARPNTVSADGIFYVGKGSGKRAHLLSDRHNRNAHHQRIVAKYGAQNVLVGVMECSTEQFAFDLEVGIIKCLTRMGVALSNQTSGGEGAAGRRHTDEERAKIALSNTGWTHTAAAREKMSDAAKKKVVSAATRAKVSAFHKGKVMSSDSRKKMSLARIGKPMSEATKLKISITKRAAAQGVQNGV